MIKKERIINDYAFYYGAIDAIRTHDLILTKDVLCLLSYNSIHIKLATRMGLEPTTSSVTG